MEKINQRKMEREFQKALAIEYVKEYCKDNNLSVEKLQSQRFTLVCNECAFEQPNDKKSAEFIIDGETQPQITLKLKYENKKFLIEETEYTKEFLGVD